MSKLFITPRHGYLGRTIDELREDQYTVSVVGYGYPPIYVEAERSQHDAIKEVVISVDPEAEFQPYRADLMEPSELIDILKQFSIAEFKELCLNLNITYSGLPGSGADDLSRLSAELVTQFRHQNNLSELVDAAYKVNSYVF